MVIREFKVIVDGTLDAPAIKTMTPISFWGGVNTEDGVVQDVHNELHGESLAGKVLCMPFDKGSCSGSGTVFEMIYRSTNPAGMLCLEASPVLALGPIIGERIYERKMPIRVISKEALEQIHSGDHIRFTEDEIIIEPSQA